MGRTIISSEDQVIEIKFPAPLRPSDRIGVMSPSGGVDDRRRPRLDFAVRTLRERGYEVVIGRCMDGNGHVSAPVAERCAEVTAMIADPDTRDRPAAKWKHRSRPAFRAGRGDAA